MDPDVLLSNNVLECLDVNTGSCLVEETQSHDEYKVNQC